jgi:hypothetical protein
MPDLATASAPGEELLYTVRGAGSGERTVAESLYEIATTQYGNPGMWRLIAAANGIADPLGLRPGTTLRIPRPPRGGTTS